MAENSLNLVELKKHTPADLVSMAKDLEIENASTMRKGDLMFSILKERADFIGLDVCLAILKVLQDGFGTDKYAPCP